MQETTDGSGGLFLDICWIVPVFFWTVSLIQSRYEKRKEREQ